MVNIKRIKHLRTGPSGIGPVLYWMSRDQRVSDNWALSYAIELAESTQNNIMVLFNITDNYLGATWRQYDFMINGLKRVEIRLKELNIPFTILIGSPEDNLPNFIRQNQISHLITDFDPLRMKREWQDKVGALIEIPFDVVDTHNIVPCFLASDKEEYSAAHFRLKIKKLMPEFLDEFPPILKQQGKPSIHRINWATIEITLKINRLVKPVNWIIPGEATAAIALEKFLNERMVSYAALRNNPNEEAVSGLSPFLHFGHISAQRIALEIFSRLQMDDNTESFLDELIVRKELADNFCYYNPAYDSVAGFKSWARESLDRHRGDVREFVYSADQFESAVTHDELWNAAQTNMVVLGSLHGYMRMYWAKKILEWSESPEEALKIALFLNDKFQLDGRDPNGYTGCAWSIGGIHDRPWPEREIYGKIRYMNRSGCERKFDVDRYIAGIASNK